MVLDLISSEQRAPAECKIYLQGKEVPEFYPFLREVRVSTSRSEAWAASLDFATVRDEMGQWEVQDRGALVPWVEIRLTVLFGEREQTLFKGYIREVNTRFPESAGEAEIHVECQDQSVRLDRTRKRRAWGTEQAPTSDRIIIGEILSQYGLNLTPDSQSGQSGLVELPQDASDTRFLKKRAEDNNYELIFYPDWVYFGPYRISSDRPQPIIQVYAGQDTHCLRFDVNTDGHLPDALDVDIPPEEEGEESRNVLVHSDLQPMGPERADSRGQSLEPHLDSLSGEGGDSYEQLSARAQAQVNDFDLHRVQADGELDGSLYGHILRPGSPVPVDGLGERLSGLYYVDRVEHQIDNQGYRQSFHLLRNAYGDNLDEVSPVASRLAGIL